MTCSTSQVPMPKARAPKAPWVPVCESPQTMVMPGLVAPSSGPIMWTMPWSTSCTSKNWMPNSAQFLRSALTCLAEVWSVMIEAVRGTGGGDVVVDGGDVAVGTAELAAGDAEAVEGLRGGDLVDEVEVDVEDGGLACRLGDEVRFQTFSKRVLGVVVMVFLSSRLRNRCLLVWG